jgi:single-stranded-DNA-specific exonuclease
VTAPPSLRASGAVAASSAPGDVGPGARPGIVDPGPAGAGSYALARELGVTITVADALSRSGRAADDATRRWLDPRLAHLTAPDGMADRQAAADRIARAVRAGERICVFGDYDCDGITATAVLTSALRALGGDVTPRLATRRDGAYGLSHAALARVRETSSRLVVTCDCGSSDHERIAAARAAGIDVVVIDHHLVPREPLPALAFLNPHRPDCAFPYKWLASCGLALSMAAALRKELGKELDLRPLLDLVAIGTVADVAPLTEDNRVLVRAGLAIMAQGRRPGLRALAERGNFAGVPLTAEDVSFRFAPRLNAPGRMADPDDALALLLEADPARAAAIAHRVEELQQQRRAIQAQMVDEALADVADGRFADAPGIVVARQGWHPGVVGIVAGRLADQLGKPTIVVGLEGARGRGSVRGPRGFPLHDALTASRDALVGFGGHQAAAGVEVEASRIEALRAAWCDACGRLGAAGFGGDDPDRVLVRLAPEDDPFDVALDLVKLDPCGEGNPEPRIVVPAARVAEARDLKGHLRVSLAFGGRGVDGIAFHRGSEAEGFRGREVAVVGSLRRDTYRGGRAVELLVHRLEPTDGAR